MSFGSSAGITAATIKAVLPGYAEAQKMLQNSDVAKAFGIVEGISPAGLQRMLNIGTFAIQLQHHLSKFIGASNFYLINKLIVAATSWQHPSIAALWGQFSNVQTWKQLAIDAVTGFAEKKIMSMLGPSGAAVVGMAAGLMNAANVGMVKSLFSGGMDNVTNMLKGIGTIGATGLIGIAQGALDQTRFGQGLNAGIGVGNLIAGAAGLGGIPSDLAGAVDYFKNCATTATTSDSKDNSDKEVNSVSQ